MPGRWNRAEKSRDVFDEFNNDLENKLVILKGRNLKQELIYFGEGKT